jgi:hypothetical protein
MASLFTSCYISFQVEFHSIVTHLQQQPGNGSRSDSPADAAAALSAATGGGAEGEGAAAPADHTEDPAMSFIPVGAAGEDASALHEAASKAVQDAKYKTWNVR